ncbi:MAG: hypothetical protein LBP64_05905 [Tannerella sp.]|jgi:hypothetical protein|nr:hypothetical protein [Tannerella sp.]
MEPKQNKLEELKAENPFRVPEGYMEGLASRIMSKIPEDEPKKETKILSLNERIRPLLYLAAVFIGLIFLFRVIINPATSENDTWRGESEPVQESGRMTDEDEEYLEYLQQEYNRNLLTVSLENMY